MQVQNPHLASSTATASGNWFDVIPLSGPGWHSSSAAGRRFSLAARAGGPEIPHRTGLVVAAGRSGSAGWLMAEEIVDGTVRSLDIGALLLERFTDMHLGPVEMVC
ncbi:MAG: hypothetical protein JO362_09600 [Streptomycetaceae bacterium]|nr:hypothetical protein [Streptomycetaceae bacterium]